MTRRAEGVLHFEDIEVGASVRGERDYPIERDEIIEFARRWDPQPFHIDEGAAARSLHGGLTASGVHLMAIRSWLMHHMGVPFAITASLGIDETRILAPVRPGDRLSLRLTWVAKRPSKSRPGVGIVEMRTELSKQDGTTVLTATDRVLVRSREPA